MMDLIDSWYDWLRIFAIFQGCFVVGMTIFILRVYWIGHPVLKERRLRHVVSISIGHIIMTFLLLRGVHIGVFGPPFIHWPYALILLIMAFFLTDYGLKEMLVSLKGKISKKEEVLSVGLNPASDKRKRRK